MSDDITVNTFSSHCMDYIEQGHPYPAFIASVDGILLVHNDALQQFCEGHVVRGCSMQTLGVELSLVATLSLQWQTTRITMQHGSQRCVYQARARKDNQYIAIVCIAEVKDHPDALLGMTALNNELVNLTRELRARNEELEKAQRVIRDLRELLPMCAGCHSIRDEEGAWHPIADYLIEHTGTTVSHGLCPNCIKRYYPDLADEE